MTRKRFVKLLMAYWHTDREVANLFAVIGLRSKGSYEAAYEDIARYWGG